MRPQKASARRSSRRGSTRGTPSTSTGIRCWPTSHRAGRRAWGATPPCTLRSRRGCNTGQAPPPSSIFSRRRAPQSTLAWVLAIVLIPYVGVPLYLVFGGRKLRRKATRKGRLYGGEGPAPATTADGGIAAMLIASGAPPPRAGNAVELLSSG